MPNRHPRRPLPLLLSLVMLVATLVAPAASAQTATEATENAGAAQSDQFEKVLLEEDIGEPMTMDIAPDGQVFLTDRGGTVRVHDPATGDTVIAAEIDTHTDPYPDGNNEGGLLGVALDPDYDDTGWIYLYYAHPEESHVQLSRFDVHGDQHIDLDSEVVLLEVESQRQDCCHLGGDLEFDADGNLYISVGDETNPFQSDGYAPIDERSGREVFDAQRTAGNTNDLRGAILRITPQPDGTYTIPDGNLFPSEEYDDDLTRPEIYVMGARNPFRMTIDDETGWLYYGMYGPGAATWNDERGPMGFDQFHQVREAGNLGWPYCIGNGYAFTPWDFAAGAPAGDPFDCENGPVNTSPNNTGMEQLPPVEPATIYYPTNWNNYPFDPPEPFLNLGSGAGGPNSGPVYRYDPDLDSDTKFPEHYDGRWFLLEWHRDAVLTAELDGDGQVVAIDDFMPEATWDHPHDAQFGPDGSLYVLEYGSGWFGPADDNGLYRIDYVGDQGENPCPAPENPPAGWQALFDGATLDGWSQAGPEGFDVDECGILQSYGGMGLLWYDETTFEDFVLRADWRTQDIADNSGVFVRFPDPGDDPWLPVDEGYEIQIYDVETDPLLRTGAVYTFAPAVELASNPVGEWNTFEIEVRGQDYRVTLNGVEVATYTGDGSRGLDGYVGLQNHAAEGTEPGDSVEFRNVWIREIDDDTPDPDLTVTVGPGGSWTFDPDEFTVNEGDTIEYVLASGFHNVVTTDADGNEVATSGPASGDWQDEPYYYTATEPGTYYIYCTPHSGTSDPDPENWTGMVGRFEVLPSADEPDGPDDPDTTD